MQIVLSVIDLSLSSAVLWWLLPPDAHISFIAFVGAYAVAVIAGIISHVPGGIGVFETVILYTLPEVPKDALLGSLLAYRVVYYLVPLFFAHVAVSHQRSQRPAWQAGPRPGAGRNLHRPDRAADCRRTDLLRGHPVVALRRNTRHGRPPPLPLPLPAADRRRSLASGRQRDRPGPVDPRACAVPPRPCGLPHHVLAAHRRHLRLPAEGPRFRGSAWCWPSSWVC